MKARLQTNQLTYLKTPLISISNVAAFTRGTVGSMLPRPTSTTLPPGRVDYRIAGEKSDRLAGAVISSEENECILTKHNVNVETLAWENISDYQEIVSDKSSNVACRRCHIMKTF